MDMSYEKEDYGSPVSIEGQKKNKQKMKKVFPTLELKGEGAKKFLKAFPELSIGQELKGDAVFKVSAIKQSETSDSSYVSDYDNSVSLECHSFSSIDEDKDDGTTVEDFEKAKQED